jgi:hypothetical protein
LSPDDPDPKLPVHPDEVNEVQWVLKGEDRRSWTIIWSFCSRSKLRALPRDVTKKIDPEEPDPVYETVRIKPGAIVYRAPAVDVPACDLSTAWFKQRAQCMKVCKVVVGEKGDTPGQKLLCAPFSQNTHLLDTIKLDELESESKTSDQHEHDLAFAISHNAKDSSPTISKSRGLVFPFEELQLLEMNRGKTGALNFFLSYLRTRVARWSALHAMDYNVRHR